MGDLIAGVLVAKVLKTIDPSHSAVIYRVFRGLDSTRWMPGEGGERNHLHFSTQPNLGVDDEGLHAQVLLDGLQAPGHGVGTLHYP